MRIPGQRDVAVLHALRRGDQFHHRRQVTTVAATGTADPGPAEAGPVEPSSLPGTPAQAGVTEAGAPGPAPQESPAPPATAQPTGRSEDAEPFRLVRIDAEPSPEASPEDPWLPGSRRPDRRALIIGVVLIAGLLSVASTAWLIGVNPPQASSPHGTHQSRPSRPGPGRAQPGQALSGQPTPILIQRSQPAPSQLQPSRPAPTQTGTSPPRPGQTGHSQSGHNQPGHDQSSGGHPGSSQSGTGTHQTGSSPPAPGQTGARPGLQPAGSGQSGPGQAARLIRVRPSGSGPSGSGSSGSGRGTTPDGPASAPAGAWVPGRQGARHPRPGVVSITPGLAGRADARRVGGLLVRYFAAVNHRRYQAYASLFAQRRQLTPRDFAWGYRTSHDSNAVLVGIAALKGGLKATVTFTSHQDPAQSPDHSSCIDWRITLFLYRTGATYLIGMPPPGYRAGLQACSFAPRQPSPGHPVTGTRVPRRPAQALRVQPLHVHPRTRAR